VVFGASGLILDNCPVFPSKPGAAGPMTIPLLNNTELLIHNKRFMFAYPPKELRATMALRLLSTPPRTPSRKLRLSMIQSAEVFSPRPSQDPMVNLRVLKSPLKARFTTSPVKGGNKKNPKQEEIVLVEGTCPKVVEDERDLVIMETVDVLPDESEEPAPQTPVRRGPPRPSLHRAVLIRSAQKAVMKMEEEEEEQEVEEFISQPISTSSSEGHDYGEVETETETEIDTEPEMQESSGGLRRTMTGLRKSLEAVAGLGWPFRSGSAPAEDAEAEEERDITEVGLTLLQLHKSA
jgi:hypothetical protein